MNNLKNLISTSRGKSNLNENHIFVTETVSTENNPSRFAVTLVNNKRTPAVEFELARFRDFGDLIFYVYSLYSGKIDGGIFNAEVRPPAKLIFSTTAAGGFEYYEGTLLEADLTS